MRYIDTHSHVSFHQYDADREAVLARMREKKVWALDVGVDYESSKRAIQTTAQHDFLFATIGIHPADHIRESFDEEKFKALINKKVVAVGECGLDYFHIKGNREESKKKQQALFEQQIVFALEHGLPLMLHCRPSRGSTDAYEDILSILKSHAHHVGENLCGNVHFFVGDINVARKFLNLNFTLSFTGVITFASDYDETIKFTPNNMILSETDCPFVAPVPYRGKRNEPAFVVEVVKRLAQLKKLSEEEMQKQIRNTATILFKLQDGLRV